MTVGFLAMTDSIVAGKVRMPWLVRYGASPAQVAALLFVALFLLAFLVVPIVRVIQVAFTGADGRFTLVHFGDFFRTTLLIEAFWNSVYVALMTVVVASLFAVPLATFLSRFHFRGAALIHTLGVVPLVMPPFVGAVAMQLIFGRNGSINLLLFEWLGFRIPFMEGLNGVIFVEAFDDEAARKGWCLYHVGCKGPATFSPCPIFLWNTRTSWPIGAGHPCLGCTERHFWDTMTPFYGRLPDVAGFGVERYADTIGAALAVGAAAGVAAHAVATGVHQIRERRKLKVLQSEPAKKEGDGHGND